MARHNLFRRGTASASPHYIYVTNFWRETLGKGSEMITPKEATKLAEDAAAAAAEAVVAAEAAVEAAKSDNPDAAAKAVADAEEAEAHRDQLAAAAQAAAESPAGASAKAVSCLQLAGLRYRRLECRGRHSGGTDSLNDSRVRL